MYSVTNFGVTEENMKFRSGTGNKLKITLNSNSQINQIQDENFPEIIFSFKNLQEVLNTKQHDIVGKI